jgi:hypothetical protein
MGGQEQDFKTRVLVVDDERVILQTMSAILESEGFAVRTAEDGFAALVTLRQTPPDIIISDLRMPNMSGFEFLSVVRRRFPHIPIIAISGEYIAAGTPPGVLMDVFLQKGGYTQQHLFDTIRRLLSDSPIRPHAPKSDAAPLWIPRREAEYIVVVCTDCLRSFPVEDESSGTEIREAECPSCGTHIRYDGGFGSPENIAREEEEASPILSGRYHAEHAAAKTADWTILRAAGSCKYWEGIWRGRRDSNSRPLP